MLKILCKRGEIAPEEQFLLLSTIFCYLMLDFYVKTWIKLSLRDKRLFEITEVEITRVDCITRLNMNVRFFVRMPVQNCLCDFSFSMTQRFLLKRTPTAAYDKFFKAILL